MEVIGEVFSSIGDGTPGNIIRIDKLDLDLGVLDTASLETELPRVLRASLLEALLLAVTTSSPGRSIVDLLDSGLEKLGFFLLYGCFPWWVHRNETFAELFSRMMELSPQRLLGLIRELCRHEYVIRRLVMQLGGPLLAQLIGQLEVTFGQWIIAYIADIKAAHRNTPLVKAGALDFEEMIWRLSLTYLFMDRGSQFNRKSFIKWNISQLASQYGMGYETLLIFLADTLPASFTSRPGSLLEIIGQLREEYLKKQPDDEPPGKPEPPEPLTIPQQVRQLEPDEYPFIESYTSELIALHRREPVVKAPAADFGETVWSFILDYLQKDRGTDFNRQSFVRANLMHIARRFDSTYARLLDFILQALPAVSGADSSLTKIFTALAQDLETSIPDALPVRLTAKQEGWQTSLREYMRDRPSECRQYLLTTSAADTQLPEQLALSFGEESDEVLCFLQPGNASFLAEYMRWIGQAADRGLIPGGRGNKTKYYTILFRQLLQSRRRIFNAELFFQETLHEILGANGGKELTREQQEAISQIPGCSAPLVTMIRKAMAGRSAVAGASSRSTRRESGRLGLLPGFGLDNPGSDGNPIYIRNAGLILLHPFFHPYFKQLDLLEQGGKGPKRFRDKTAIDKGIHALQYLVDGRTTAPEHELPLNKLLCGCPLEEPIALEAGFTDEEKALAESLLKGAIANWSMLNNSSPGALQTFFAREGRLTRQADRWTLQVENKTVDILIDHLPWGIGIIKQDWMEQSLHVKWRK